MDHPRVPRNRRLAFSLVLVVAAIIIIETALRLTGLVAVFNPLIQTAAAPDGNRGHRYQFNAHLPEIKTPPPPSTVRIIVIGESAVAGYPFEGAGFPEQTAAIISELNSGATVHQFINLGVNGINTDAEREILRDALPALQPDVVIIYAGNNEILTREKINDLDHPRLKAAVWWLRRHSRLWNLPGNAAGYFISRGLSMTLLLHIAHADETVGQWINDPQQRLAARDLYLHHLRQMIQLAREHGAIPILCTPAANLRDWVPMKSVHTAGRTPDVIASNNQQLETARTLIRDGRAGEARPALINVTDSDPDFAKGWFVRGRAELLSGRTTDGIAHLTRAVEQADFFQQTPPSWCREVRRLARETGTPLVDVEADLRRQDPLGAPGFELFVDGCHPTLDGYYLIAGSLTRGLVREGIVRTTDRPLPPQELVVAAAGARVNYLSLQYFNQSLVLALLYGYPEYQEAALGYLERSVAMGFSPGLADPYQGLIQVMLGHPERAGSYFSRGRAADPKMFASTVKKKLGRVMVMDDPWLGIKPPAPDDLPGLYPIGDLSPDPDLSLRSCPYRYEWDGSAYKFAPP